MAIEVHVHTVDPGNADSDTTVVEYRRLSALKMHECIDLSPVVPLHDCIIMRMPGGLMYLYYRNTALTSHFVKFEFDDEKP